MHQLPAAFAAMGAYRQFMCYVLTPSTTRPGKMDKLPVSPHTGAVVTAHDPQHWTTADHACLTASTWGEAYGVAFVFTEADPFWFLDLDACRDPATGQWSALAQTMAQAFAGAAMEVSRSGNGLHIFGTGACPPHGKKNAALNAEFYTELRFVALTGTGATGNAGTDHTAALQWLTANYFPNVGGSTDGDFTLSDAPVPEWIGPTDDADLIRRALQSRSAASSFGARASFRDLWEANLDALAAAYPDPARPYDASQADAALISHLAFWTGRHGQRIESLMRQSALAREKWERDDYLPRSIAAVLARPGDVLKDKLPEPPSTPPALAQAPTQTEITGSTFLNPAAQKDLFAGCVYVVDAHKVLIPGGDLVDAQRFRALFGGYTFAMDAINERTTRNAFEAFTESQALRAPVAQGTCFKPDVTPGTLVDVNGRQLVNRYWPAKIARQVGDASPFLNHLRKVLPDQRDQAILLNYMAACVQYQGKKFAWAPVLQGVEGNGKTLFSLVTARAIGAQFVHWPKAADLASEFNAFLANRILVCVEEMYSAEHSVEILENLKTIISGADGIQIQKKGVDQDTQEIVCNLMLTTNHRNAVRKTADNGRRLAVFFTAQQTKADMLRDGMGGDYFPRLYHWLRHEGGFAIVSELLYTMPIDPQFDPSTTLHRAPATSTDAEVVAESRGGVEQQIAEVIAQDTPGFMGGWVSSVMLDRLISDTLKLGTKLPLSKRREILYSMGYVLHPGLTDGRVNNPVQPDGRKPQLFILANHPAVRLTGAAEIAKAYSAAQMVSPVRA